MRSSSGRRKFTATAALLLMALVVGPLAATETADAQHPQGRDKGIRVSWTRSPDPEASPVSTLPPLCASENRCVISFLGPRYLLDGDLVGELMGGAAAAPLVPGAPGGAAAIAILSLTDSPCGSGSMVIAGVIVSDPASGASGTWQVIPKAGTGDLVDVTGSGRLTPSPDGSTGTYRGRIFCNASAEV